MKWANALKPQTAKTQVSYNVKNLKSSEKEHSKRFYQTLANSTKHLKKK